MSAPDEAVRRLPLDADAPGRSRAVHLRPDFLLLVAAGGALGTGARELLSAVVPSVDGFPVPVFVINLVGAFVLGLLLERLARGGPDAGRRRLARLFGGTGFCGGFTTYSSLATASAVLAVHGAVPAALVYGGATVVLGGLASWVGIAVGAAGGRRSA